MLLIEIKRGMSRNVNAKLTRAEISADADTRCNHSLLEYVLYSSTVVVLTEKVVQLFHGPEMSKNVDSSQKTCARRESNSRLVDGNDEFYH